MAIWPEYDCRRVVRAAAIVNIFEANGPNTCRVLFVDPVGDGKVEPYVCTDDALTNRAEIGWVAVIYKDGLRSAFPRVTFDADYVKRDAAVAPSDPGAIVVS